MTVPEPSDHQRRRMVGTVLQELQPWHLDRHWPDNPQALRAHLLRIGSTLCVGNVDLTDEDGRAIGTAIVTYMLINPPAVRTSDLGPQASARVPGARRVTRPSRRK